MRESESDREMNEGRERNGFKSFIYHTRPKDDRHTAVCILKKNLYTPYTRAFPKAVCQKDLTYL